MEKNEVTQIIKDLEQGLEGKSVRYAFEDNLHQFIIEGGGLTFYIYLHPLFFDEEEPIEILNEFYKYNIIETLNEATEPVWLYLSITGLKQVDENFAGEEPS